MKRYISILIALVAIAMGAKADDVIYYGFQLDGLNVTSSNYESYKQYGYDYDPFNNVLHITKIGGCYVTVEGDVNPSLNISIDADIKESSNGDYVHPHLYKWLRFKGSGHHVISGTGSLHLTTFTQGTYLSETNNPIDVGTSHLTIKDIDIYINAVNGYGFYVKSGGSLTFYHSSVKVITGDGTAVMSEGSLSLKYCRLKEGEISSDGSQFIDSDGFQMDHIDIEQTEARIPADVINVTVAAPVVGKTAGNTTAEVDCPQYCYPEVKWRKITGSNSFTPLSNSDIFEVGYAYAAQVTLHPQDSYVFSEDLDFSIITNGQAIPFYWDSNEAIVLISFPQILDPFYDLWVSDQPVKESNRNAIPVSHGTCSYNPDTKTLTLNNVNYTNSNENSGGTVSGYGIYSNIDNLTINLEGSNYISSTHGIGLFSMKNLTITGNGILFIGANEGTALAMGSYGYNLKITGGAQVLAQGMYGVTGGIHTVTVGGEELVESYVTTLSVSSPDAELRAYGTQQCVKTVASLGEGMEFICENNPNVKLYHKNWSICYYERNRYFPYSNDWIKMTNPNGGISTGLEVIDNGEMTIDSSLPLYNLHGQRVSHPVKGQIYIQNGRKVKF